MPAHKRFRTKVIIQCAGSKDRLAGTFFVRGHQVEFIAHPEHYDQPSTNVLARPDDVMPSSSATWREYLQEYNRTRRQDNPYALLPAARLYAPRECPTIYQDLLESLGSNNLYILSAGWGLIRSDYLIPTYDITFSSQAPRWKRRTTRDDFHDFNHLGDRGLSADDTVCFLGGKDYLPLLYRLTRPIPARKVIYFASAIDTTDRSYEYIRYQTNGWNQNWHYRCAQAFIAGKVKC